MPGPTRNELIARRTAELLEKGYRRSIIDIAMDWAVGSAEGMATYVAKQAGSDEDGKFDHLADQFLPQYLQDAEKWIRSFVGEPEKQ